MSTSTQSRRSDVWQHFENLTSENKAECKLCHVKLAYHGTTSNLRNHLKMKHKSLQFGITSKDSGHSTAGTSKITSGEFSQKQLTLHSFERQKMQKSKWKTITRTLVEMCAHDMRPLSIVNGKGFKSFIQELNPLYNIPSHTTVRYYLKYYYSDLKTTLISELMQQRDIALTTDTWTSVATESYITVTAHYLDANWKMRHRVLSTVELAESHTGENLAQALKDIVEIFHIQPQSIVSITTDNASNMVASVRNLEWCHIRCFGHTLQLSIKRGLDLPEVSRALGAARKLVGHFNKSSIATHELHVRQKQLDLKEHSLIQDVSTRWNSGYFMIKRLLEQRLAVFAVIHNPQIVKPCDARILELGDNIWHTMEEVVPIMKPLQMATAALCSETYATASMIYPVVFGLLDVHLKTLDSDSQIASNFKSAVSQQLRQRFLSSTDEEFCQDPCLIATALDPRYKSLKFLTVAQKGLLKQTIAMKIGDIEKEKKSGEIRSQEEGGTESLSSGQSDACPVSPVTSSSDCGKGKDKQQLKRGTMEFLLGDYYESSRDQTVQTTGKDEIDAYFTEKVFWPEANENPNPLNWWSSNAHRFKLLSELAHKYLSLCGTSVPSERIFSATGNTVTKRRACLDPETVNELIFVRETLREGLSDDVDDSDKSDVGVQLPLELGLSPAKERLSLQRDKTSLPPLPTLSEEENTSTVQTSESMDI